jgi:hypothetical protein
VWYALRRYHPGASSIGAEVGTVSVGNINGVKVETLEGSLHALNNMLSGKTVIVWESILILNQLPSSQPNCLSSSPSPK